MRRLILALAVWTALVSGIPTARAGNFDRTTTGQDVTVSISSPFTDLPPSGTMPFRVNIKNDRSTPGTWRIVFQAVANTSSSGATAYKQDLTVAPNSTGSFEVIVPLPVVSANYGGTSLNVGVTGPGFDNSSLNRQFFASFYSNYTKARSPFVVFGKDVLGDIGSGSLENYYKGQGREFYGSVVDTASLPSDWRSYSGAAILFLKDTEWLSLSATQRQGVCDYVAQGGQLTLFTSENPETRTPELQLPEPDGKPGDYGFGTISLVQSPSFPPENYSLYTAIEHDYVHSAQAVDQNFPAWGLRQTVGTIAVSGAFILTFVVLFGGLIGPVNLYVFARGNKRFRLFWTTPLISIAASLALVAGILITDGIGGSGRQMIAIYSLPGSNREAVVQEQIARTALLFSSQWHNDQAYLITPISEEAVKGKTGSNVIHYRGARADLADSPDTFLQEGNTYSGNWFRSRTVSGQYLQAVRPSRSVLTVLNPQASGAPQEAPVVLSSFPQELTQVYLRDQQGNYWTCENLQPGRKTTCTSCGVSDLNQFWKEACSDAGGKLRPFLENAANRTGCFYATAAPLASDSLTTLGGIRWQVEDEVVLGPWVASSTPENGP